MSEQLSEDLDAVIEELEKKIEELREIVMARHHLGLGYMKAGRVEEAIASVESAL